VTLAAQIQADPDEPSEIEVNAELAVISGRPDDVEVAAITAVLSGVLEELAAEQGRRKLAGPSAWARSQRILRAPLQPGPGAWRSFSG
jgi:hypothetical protein